MTSTENSKISFSMEDFEKGLMLAGLISPSNNMELQERNELENYERELSEQKRHTYFKRVVLAAKIACELHSQPTFGRIKFQKLMYLCENAAQLNLEWRYSKQAAGPFDNKFMHSIEEEFRYHKWFDVIKENDGTITRSKYVPLENLNQYNQYYNSYFAESLESIDYTIEVFRTLKTDATEIAATLLACYLEITNSGCEFTEKKLLELFYSWSKEKSRFDELKVKSTWTWLKEKGLIVN